MSRLLVTLTAIDTTDGSIGKLNVEIATDPGSVNPDINCSWYILDKRLYGDVQEPVESTVRFHTSLSEVSGRLAEMFPWLDYADSEGELLEIAYTLNSSADPDEAIEWPIDMENISQKTLRYCAPKGWIH
jgi:hypothetical protein